MVYFLLGLISLPMLKFVQALYRLGCILLEQNNVEEALVRTNQALTLHPTNVVSLLLAINNRKSKTSL